MQDPGTDPLSPLAQKVIGAGTYSELVVTTETSATSRELIDGVTPDQLLAVPMKNPAGGYAMLAGLLLWIDDLHGSHSIAQMLPEELHRVALNLHRKGSKTSLNVVSVESVENDNGASQQQLADATVSLSFWHAIMHRREGDFSNSKYWYARCANHPALATLAVQAGGMINPFPADKSLLRVVANGFDPGALVDLVQAVHESPDHPHHALAIALQRLEWRVLFDHCTRASR